MVEKFQEKYSTEQEARANAAHNYSDSEVAIVESKGAFYLEDSDSSTFLRTWEREVYRGLGRTALCVHGRMPWEHACVVCEQLPSASERARIAKAMADHHCPMCGELWDGQKCRECGWKEPKR